MESNFDILGISDSSTQYEIREAFRKLVLKHHSDRGGDVEQFKKIRQAYEDLRSGKKYPDTDEERKRKSRVYSGDSDDDIRRKNMLLAQELAADMQNAEQWIASQGRTNSDGARLFGSKTLGEIEFERKASGAVSIKGNYMAGKLTHDGPILMQGNITSPSWSPEHSTVIRLTRGDFKMVNPIDNKYKIENGAKIAADNGDIFLGNVFGKKDRIQDPGGRIGLYNIREHRTELNAPNGKIILENAVNTVSINGDTVIALNLEDDVRIRGREILIYGSKMTYDVEIELVKNGTIRFFEKFSVQGLSDDSVILLENGKSIRLHDIKTRKIRDLAEEFIPKPNNFGPDDTMVGKGFTITYDMLDSLGKGPSKKSGGWASRLGF